MKFSEVFATNEVMGSHRKQKMKQSRKDQINPKKTKKVTKKKTQINQEKMMRSRKNHQNAQVEEKINLDGDEVEVN